jgi:hypothetical protein
MARWVLPAALLTAGCGGGMAASVSSGSVRPRTASGARARVARPSHVAVILMENHDYGDIIGSPTTPYINALAKRYALATQMHAITHPSLPNYLALTGGSTFGISSDCTDCTVRATSLVDQLEHAGISWKAYMEDLPSPCFTGAAAGEYAKKHDPFAYYTRIVDDPARCKHIVPLGQLNQDERAGALPAFIWITPNLCHDMHDCAPATGARFLSTLIPHLLRALGSSGVLFLTWDEGVTDSGCCRLASGGHIATIVAGAMARPGGRMRTPADHYSVLATIEDLFGLPRLRGAGCGCTPPLDPLLRRRLTNS